MVKTMELRLIVGLILILMPSIVWLLLRPIHSPWWLENTLSSPLIILVIFSFLMLALSYFFSYLHSLSYYLSGLFVNFLLVIFLNNTINLTNLVCSDSVKFFQFNTKYTEQQHEISELIEHLITNKYQLIALQGVSQHSKQQIVEKLSPYYPYFIRGESQQVFSDQLLFSRYAFSKIKYYKSGQRATLIASQWHLPVADINLYTLHPPSPRNEKFWRSRNKILYQLNYALKSSLIHDPSVEASQVNNLLMNPSLVIGDLNISKHSNRINLLKQGMNTEFVNSWPKHRYVASFLGVAIDHFWVSKQAKICKRQRINKFNWSDHYAITTQVDFKSSLLDRNIK
jgi:endonuclease/exonuclease/phosphatase (EEP) superfamily protein YafD